MTIKTPNAPTPPSPCSCTHRNGGRDASPPRVAARKAPAHSHPKGPACSTLHRQARRTSRVHTALSLCERVHERSTPHRRSFPRRLLQRACRMLHSRLCIRHFSLTSHRKVHLQSPNLSPYTSGPVSLVRLSPPQPLFMRSPSPKTSSDVVPSSSWVYLASRSRHWCLVCQNPLQQSSLPDASVSPISLSPFTLLANLNHRGHIFWQHRRHPLSAW